MDIDRPPAGGSSNKEECKSKIEYQKQTEEEYKVLQEKMTAEQIELIRKKTEAIYQQSNYTFAGQDIPSPALSPIPSPAPSPTISSTLIGSSSALQQLLSLTTNTSPTVSEMDSVIRLLNTKAFTCSVAVAFLFKNTKNIEIYNFICNSLCKLPDDDIEFYLIDLWFFIFFSNKNSFFLIFFIFGNIK